MAEVWYLSRTKGTHDQRWVRTLEEDGHRVRQLMVGDASAATLREIAQESPVDLVVAGPLTDAATLAVDSEVAPVLGIAWGFDLLLEADEPGMRESLKQLLPELAGVHVDCRHLAELATSLGAHADAVSVGAWGIDTEGFSRERCSGDPRGSAGWSAENRVVLTTRTWAPLYHVDVVLRGFADAYSRDDTLRLAWGGHGPEAASLRKLVEALGIGHVIHELGRLDAQQLRDWLCASDVYVSASTSDGSSLSLLETMAVGVPVVVTDLPSNREWVLDDEIGATFPIGSARSLGEAISSVLARKQTAAMRDRRRQLVLERGDWRTNRQTFLNAVERVIR